MLELEHLEQGLVDIDNRGMVQQGLLQVLVLVRLGLGLVHLFDPVGSSRGSSMGSKAADSKGSGKDKVQELDFRLEPPHLEQEQVQVDRHKHKVVGLAV